MSIINKNKICLNYLIGVLICGFVIYANYIYKMENGTGGRLDFTWDFRRSGFCLSCEIFSCKEGGSFFKIVRSTY